MKRLYIIFTILALFIGVGANAQKISDFKVKLKGFVSYKMIGDSKQVVTDRDGELLFFPFSEKLDLDGNDIEGMISGALYGTGNDKVGLFRVCQAYVKLKIGNTELIAGKTWHSLFANEEYLRVLDFGVATPINPRNGEPHFRYRVNMNKIEWLAAISTQQDLVNTCPGGRKPSFFSRLSTPEVYTHFMS